MHKGNSINKFAKKMILCYANISAEISLLFLGYSFCTEHYIFATLCHKKLSVQKLLYFGAKNVGEIDLIKLFDTFVLN
jgi:hypothetical protein